MSNLRREVQSKTPAYRPQRPAANVIPEEDSGDSSSASSISSTGTLVPNETARAVLPLGTDWPHYFDQELYLDQGDVTFHVYISPPQDISKDPLFVCHHGAGSNGLSFACLAAAIRRRKPSAGILAIDAKGHGSYFSKLSHSPDFSLSALSQDLVTMLHATQEKLKWPDMPNLVLVGHSLGGAVVADIAHQGVLGPKLVGFVVIDVVEGSAMDALKSMQAYLSGRPNAFESVEAAIDWHVRSRTIRNRESAAVSVPALLQSTNDGRLVWRMDLLLTQKYWSDWFVGLSNKFLTGKAAKLLLLAGTDRLDKDLMIGQMQGKFQLQVFPEAGHFVQEDIPDRVADTVIEFYRRNDKSALILPPKVSDLLAQGRKV